MRMHLSSWRVGHDPGQLLALTGGVVPVAVIGNALDAADPRTRQAGVDFEISALANLGYDASELDLRVPGAASGLGVASWKAFGPSRTPTTIRTERPVTRTRKRPADNVDRASGPPKMVRDTGIEPVTSTVSR